MNNPKKVEKNQNKNKPNSCEGDRCAVEMKCDNLF